MDDPRTLTQLLERAARLRPAHPAVEEPPDHAVSWAELDRMADAVCAHLRGRGVRPGDRVGLYLPKSIDSVAAAWGIMKAGAAYVPVDSTAPPARCAWILHDCTVRTLFVTDDLRHAWQAEARALGDVPDPVVLRGTGGGWSLAEAVAGSPPEPAAAPAAADLAYILYTSGSTGKPKGVMLTHENAVAFVRWCVETFGFTAADRFSSHAPLHFDLSVFDLYVSAWMGATVVLIGAEAGKEPVGLVDLLAERRLSVWYSTPSILSLMVQYGKPARHAYPALRQVFFAGEVFPVGHLRHATRAFPAAYFNLYGPTETNVCTWHPIPAVVPADRTEPYPIGRVCAHLRSRVVDPDGVEVPRGAEGELCIAGPNVMQAYWNLPEQTAGAFLVDPDGTRWYRTGDIVCEGEDGVFAFRGRRDRMVKRRGYRIELGEIEAALYRNPDVREVAAVATRDAAGDVRITAYLAMREGVRPGLVAMKQYCAGALPLYMVPDAFVFRDTLPKTSTDKVDYQALLRGT